VHGWDVARATGQPYACEPELLDATRSFLGPACLALHVAGIGTGWYFTTHRRWRLPAGPSRQPAGRTGPT
jgi:hypothetical protein